MTSPVGRWLFPLTLFLAGCVGAGECVSPLHVHTATNEAGELWASIDGAAPERLLSDAEDVRPVLAPGGAWLAVEERRMSNLTVVRLFLRDGNRFVPWERDITATAWQRAGESDHFDYQSVEVPQTFIEGWEDSGQKVVLVLRGVWGDPARAQETRVTIALGEGSK